MSIDSSLQKIEQNLTDIKQNIDKHTSIKHHFKQYMQDTDSIISDTKQIVAVIKSFTTEMNRLQKEIERIKKVWSEL